MIYAGTFEIEPDLVSLCIRARIIELLAKNSPDPNVTAGYVLFFFKDTSNDNLLAIADMAGIDILPAFRGNMHLISPCQ